MGKTASEYYAAKLASFQAAQALRKEHKTAKQYAHQLAYNRRWLKHYRLRLKRDAKEESKRERTEQKEQLKWLLQEARRILNGR